MICRVAIINRKQTPRHHLAALRCSLYARLLLVCIIFLFSAIAGTPSVAQDAQVLRELQRLSKDLSDLQQYIYKDKRTGAVDSVKSTTSDTSSKDVLEVAVASRMLLQIQAIDSQLRQVTGKLEEMEYSISTLAGRLDRLVGDVDLRLQMLESSLKASVAQQQAVQQIQPQVLASSPPKLVQQIPLKQSQSKINPLGSIQLGSAQGTTIITSAGTTGTSAMQQAIPSGQTSGLLAGQKSLGVVTGSQLAAVQSSTNTKLEAIASHSSSQAQKKLEPLPKIGQRRQTLLGKTEHATHKPVVSKQASTLSMLPPGTPKQKYDYAFSLLQKRDYALAEQALRAFIEQHSENQYAGNAYYWLGETYYVRKQWQDAAIIFADGYKRSPEGAKAPDNLLKLGKSLTGVGETVLACKTFIELLTKFPNANTRILDNAKSELGRVGCQ